MKIAPKSLLVLLLYLILLSGCRYRTDNDNTQESSPEVESPVERTKDSSQHIKSNDPALPQMRFPKDTKKKPAADLDTLRPIKA